LTKRGYRVFFDLDEMKRNRFDEQIYNHIHNAKDIIVVLENGSLASVENGTYKDDWFCKELMFALKEGKNIIPLLLDGYKMPDTAFFPPELKDFPFKNALPFGGLSYFEDYIDKLEQKGYITASPVDSEKERSLFKFYSKEDCKVFADGKLIGDVTGQSDEPFYFFVKRKGKYRFKAVNSYTRNEVVITESIDNDAEEIVDIEWPKREIVTPEIPKPKTDFTEDNLKIEIGNFSFNMKRVDGGKLTIGATEEQDPYADENEFPTHEITVSTFYISEYLVTQNLFNLVMGYNKSHFKDEYNDITISGKEAALGVGSAAAFTVGPILGALASAGAGLWAHWNKAQNALTPKNHNPVESISLLEAREFCHRLSHMTGLHFSLPTEEEWEYAARGGQKSEGYVYAGSNDIEEVAWYRNNGEEKTHPVGLKKPNELDIYDMSGNVWEWTETPAHSYLDNSTEKAGNIYVRRGGSWWHEASNCRVSKRYMSTDTKKTSGLGFRIVLRASVSMLSEAVIGDVAKGMIDSIQKSVYTNKTHKQ